MESDIWAGKKIFKKLDFFEKTNFSKIVYFSITVTYNVILSSSVQEWFDIYIT